MHINLFRCLLLFWKKAKVTVILAILAAYFYQTHYEICIEMWLRKVVQRYIY